MSDRNQSNEQKFRDWVRKEIGQMQYVISVMSKVITNLEAKQNGKPGTKPAKPKA